MLPPDVMPAVEVPAHTKVREGSAFLGSLASILACSGMHACVRGAWSLHVFPLC
jgi:hypothetical protein